MSLVFISGLVSTIVSGKSAQSWKSVHPLLQLNFCHSAKVYSNECWPWSELHIEFEKHTLKGYICISELRIIIPKVTITYLSIDGCRYCSVHRELHHAHCDMMLFRVLCVIRTQLRSQWWFLCTLLFCPVICFKGIELLDMGTQPKYLKEHPPCFLRDL